MCLLLNTLHTTVVAHPVPGSAPLLVHSCNGTQIVRLKVQEKAVHERCQKLAVLVLSGLRKEYGQRNGRTSFTVSVRDPAGWASSCTKIPVTTLHPSESKLLNSSDSDEENTVSSETVMVPMADLLNHSPNHNAALNFGEHSLSMKAVRSIQKVQYTRGGCCLWVE